MTLRELEQIENLAHKGQSVDPKDILMLTAHLREILQAKAIAEALAVEAMRKAGVKSRYYTEGVSR